MAKITIVIEDSLSNGQMGTSFQLLPMQMNDADLAIANNQVSGAAAVGFAIRALWRNGDLYEYAKKNIDALVEEAALEVALSEAEAARKYNRAQTVNQNISPDLS